MALDPRTPVVVGVGQWTNRVDQGDEVVEPADLLAGALRRAGDDSGAGGALLHGVEAVRVVSMFSGRYRNPAALVGERIGARPHDVAVSPVGGNEPQVLLNGACRDIAGGHVDVVAIGGAEAWRSWSGARGARERLPWTAQGDDVAPARLTAPEGGLTYPHELARGIALPAQVYPLFEQALRHAAGRDVDEHLVAISELWADFAAVAAGNPHAWIRTPRTAEQIRTATPDNRWITWPYTKLMCANNAVEQAAGLILCSAERARALGVPRDRWVFPLAGTEAHDTYAVSHRADLRSSPALRLAGQRLFALAEAGVHDVAHVDLYSCFPSAVQIAAAELGLGTDRSLTVTGGLSFAGGPWNNYVSHSIAAMAGVLRDDPGSIGLVTANGGYVTKHALGLYSTEPTEGGFAWADVQDEVDAVPSRELCEHPDGPAVIESWVVSHDRDGLPERVIAACLVEDGRRAWASSTHVDVVGELRDGGEQIGRAVKLTPEGDLLL
ncbi:MAG TPA: acetyl-CoA acetyltransferase [Acidimicrobiales bacterium]|nr:acetyl-CoA acetyltransferase [Acidimicrobiales bacterium]